MSARVVPIFIKHIFVSPGHNFFSQPGDELGRFPIEDCAEVRCEADRGLVGDRFYHHKLHHKGQVTFFAWNVFEEMLQALGRTDVPPSAMRRNILISGVDLNTLIGKTFSVGDVHFEGVQEASPCEWMNRAVASGARDFLRGRGGLRARILQSGVLRCGEAKLAIRHDVA